MANINAQTPNKRLFFIGRKIVYIYYSQFQGSDREACGIDTHAGFSLGVEFPNEHVLSFLETLHSERHTAQVGYLLLCVA